MFANNDRPLSDGLSMKNLLLALSVFVSTAALGHVTALADDVASDPEASDLDASAIHFNRHIRPILFGKCVICHGPDENERAAGLRLDTFEGACEDMGGYAAIVPGNAEDSEIILRICTDDPDARMPPTGKADPLTQAEIDLLTRWINQGAKYDVHWSYQKPTQPKLPEVKQKDWAINAIDHFTLAKMEAAGLSPSPMANKLALARRVALDVTGLPPTWEQAKAFAEDTREDAYERYVDQLLASPAFGERWARVWLDLARYADSAGYADDPARTIWGYRDYVIRSLNANKPFDQFTIEQIAGDLLDNPTEEQLIATAFHRNTLTNNEGGTNDEEFRNVAVVDRVNTTMAVWMGTTMACAQCHTHKYDPITQEEYFRFFAFFNQSEDADRRNESPVIDLWSQEQKQRKQALTDEIATLQQTLKTTTPAIDKQRQAWVKQMQTAPQWRPAQYADVSSGRELQHDEDGWIKPATDDTLENDTYEITLSTTKDHPITGLQMQIGTEQARNFVLSQVTANWKPLQASPVTAQFVRVTVPGKNRFVHLAEIQVFQGDNNVAVKGKASQSSQYQGAAASRVNDGNTNGDYNAQSVQHTESQDSPWVEIDLGKPLPIDRIALWNRTDGGAAIADRIKGYQVSLLDGERNEIWTQLPGTVPQPSTEFSLSGQRAVGISVASADFEQSGFDAASVLTTKVDPNKGWAIADQVRKQHELTLVLSSPLPAEPGELLITLKQQSKHKSHLLDHFRFLETENDDLSRWAKVPSDVRRVLLTENESLTDAQQQRLVDYYLTIATELDPVRTSLQNAEKQLAGLRAITTVPVMRQLAENRRRVTKIQLRGNYQSTGDEVHEGTPIAFHKIKQANADALPTRLDLANWLVDPENPLTARVIVNRHWEQLFGIGIVETSEEFGSQGEPPSHPGLLDYLAVDFQANDWDLKRLIKQMVLSATYRQSSVTNADAYAADPGNRLLTRGPRFRVSAEMVRDQALMVAGLLSEKQFGPPVKPPQPNLGLKAAFGSGTDWKTSGGEDKYRRGLYTTWRRSSPYPSMAQFDAPNREVCTVRRIRTNTPLQALVTLNDPVYVEAAQAFARLILEQDSSDEARIRFAFQRALIRPASDAEIASILRLVEQVKVHFEDKSDEAVKLATAPLGALPAEADVVEHAAWTVAANVILNLDELFMKR